jgi:glycosyltransferase involved in cell wall biosynthesis
MRVAIVHDYLTHMGGGERVLAALADAFPDAPIFTLVYDKGSVQFPFDERRIRTSFLQRFPGAKRSHRYLPLALMPLAVEQFDLSSFDVILSNTHSFGKGVVVPPGTMHISYCMTPIRYAWDGSHRYVREFSSNVWFQKFAPSAISYVRMWDYAASQRVHRYITLSQYVAKRIQKYYGRTARVVYPPVDVQRFHPAATRGDYYVIVSRLVPYKRIDLAIAAANALNVPLKIAGTGPDMEQLQRQAGPSVEFLGFVPDDALPELYRNAKALLFPQEEDFGITPLEAAASGIPTIAYAAGGALETIRDGITGKFFHEQTLNSLIDAMQEADHIQWNSDVIRSHAATFSQERFIREIREEIGTQWKQFAQEQKQEAY